MARTLIRPATQIRTVDDFEDQLPSGPALEDPNGTLENLLQAILSQLQWIIGTGNWYDSVYPGLMRRGACSPNVVTRSMLIAADTTCFYPNDFVITPSGEIVIEAGGELVTIGHGWPDISDLMFEYQDINVRPNRFVIRHNLTIPDGVSVTIQNGGKLLLI